MNIKYSIGIFVFGYLTFVPIIKISDNKCTFTVADPGFPVGGGVDLVGGGVDSRGGYVLKILYVKMKELGPLGGARAGRAPPRSANDSYVSYQHENSLLSIHSSGHDRKNKL